MTKKISKSGLCAAALFAVAFLGAGATHAAPLKWTDLSYSGIADPAGALPNGLSSLVYTPSDTAPACVIGSPCLIDSKSQYKDNFGSLGDSDVINAMESASWFNTDITAVAQANSGNCNQSGSLVTCSDSPTKSGTYAGLLANLFVVHVGGAYNDFGGCTKTAASGPSSDPCAHGGGIILAFLYNQLITEFSVSGFTNGVSWIRAFTALGKLETPVEPVPLPGGIVLLLSAMCGLGVLGRRRISSAS